ncbi:tetratricopeptide repeat protein [Thermoleptolyngbya sp. PKUAC-SCTB121]|uniref:tetratricopeptide repeat protein n=1 Tax=Thermoleptolyngbya sp. PKUAC-SCTB121 TaxID=2811482 RepID=UPI0019647AFB|nr:tetratricopeptide repeat protein [Thermoleptolyngbya sp. PKUAC-SCTB121]
MSEVLDWVFQGDTGGAIAYCEARIAQGETDLQHYALLGLALLLQGQEAEAQAVWMTPLSDAEPDALEAYLSSLANLLEQALTHCLAHQQYPAAERLSRQLLELDAEQATYHHRLGIAQAQRGDLDAALASWQQAIALQPDFVDAWAQQAQTYQTLGQFAEAGESYAAWTRLQPDNADAWAGLGLCQGKLGNWAAAVQAWGQSHALAPDAAPVLADMSYGLLQLGQAAEALSGLRQALWQRSDFAETYCAWAKTPPQNPAVCANAAFLETLAVADHSDAALHQAGNLLARGGQLERAIALYQQALQENPSNFAAVIDLGNALVQTGQMSEAIALYQTPLSEAPNAADLWLSLGQALWKQGDAERAIAAAHHALSLHANREDAHRLLGLAYLAQGNADLAAEHWRSLLAQQPEAVEGWYNLAAALMQTGEPAEALQCLQTALKLNSNLAPQVANLLAGWQNQGRGHPPWGATSPMLDDPLWEKTRPVDAPTREVRTLPDWVASEPRASFTPVHPPQVVALKPPRCLEPRPHLSFGLGDALSIPGTFVATLPNGRFWLDSDQSSLAVFNAAGEVMRDCSAEFPLLTPGHPDLLARQHWVFSSQKLPPIERLSGTVAVLAGVSNNIYFHWMLDVLPRLKVLQDGEFNLNEIDYWLVGDCHSWQQDSLHHLQIPSEKVLSVQEHLHIQADQLIIPSFPGAAAWPQAWVCDWLKSSFLHSQTLAPDLPKRLYLSRQKTRDRRIINEESVVKLLESQGFATVYLETCTIAEQAQLFYNAELIVSPHGSGLTNLAFCRPGTQVVELFSPNYVYPCYWYLSNLIGLDYAYLLGEVPAGHFWQSLLYPLVRVEDIFVNLDALAQMVGGMMR